MLIVYPLYLTLVAVLVTSQDPTDITPVVRPPPRGPVEGTTVVRPPPQGPIDTSPVGRPPPQGPIGISPVVQPPVENDVEYIPVNYTDYLEVSYAIAAPPTGTNSTTSQMGTSNACDNGTHSLQVDFDGDVAQYTCQTFEDTPIAVNLSISTPKKVQCIHLDSDYSPTHHCMNHRIEYYQRLPTFQGHRPVWAQYGEYTYCPVQRWMHNIEHGAIVFLYHPCADGTVVNQFKQAVKSCVRKHVITPSRRVLATYPYVLLAWGCSLEMAEFDERKVQKFITRYALKQPKEGSVAKDGQFNDMLIEAAEIPQGSNINDTVLCPNFEA